MSLGPWQLLIIALIILVLFGRGRISEMMGDFGKGIRSFKAGMNEGEENPAPPRLPAADAPPPAVEPVQTTTARPGDRTE
ncbi:twin-arginine translocase TatA/TatE family subunit [Erythrobacteraceae bacterium CFH 75059]|uniref:twin-arginine translocase TatA/TatE family subunit n=1 Tax=Qipengyuania thermophila TaxID=2509361 RepID=UPI0010209DD3|nr:twin-arginine translocase TatA/TatE family subunit [Qipengyuania thermophila]TCD06209.1 twin-arginine translocase TatA/TatE family subunit [Erythrobacteraceae bacterium CFH 75059]